MRSFLVPVFLIGWPLAEIAGFVLLGRALGLWITLGLVIGTAILGAILLRSQGMHILRKISTEGREGRVPGAALVDASMIVLAGIMLLLPGFLTDIVGLALFLPFVRRMIWSLIGRRVFVVRSANTTGFRYDGNKPSSGQQQPGPVVDLDEDDFQRNPNSASSNTPSPWAGPKGGGS